MKKIEEALYRFKELVDSLECECDDYHGYTCPIHKDRLLARSALTQYVWKNQTFKRIEKRKGENYE